MITLPIPRDNQLIAQAIASGSYRTRELLKIGGEDWSPAIENAVWGSEEIPLYLDALLSETLPDRLVGEPIELYSEVEGILVPQLLIPELVGGLSGPASSFETSGDSASVSEPGTTDFQAFSVGSLFNREDGAKFEFTKDYPGNTPEYIVRDLAFRLPFNKSHVNVQPVGSPILSFVRETDSPGFLPWDKIGDGLSRVASQVPYLFRDTAYAGFDARLDMPLGDVTEATPTYRAQDMEGWRPPVMSQVQYRFVVVYRQEEDGSEAFKPVYAEVPQYGRKTPSWAGATLWIPLDDTTEGARDTARQVAYDEATRMSRGMMHGEEFPLPIHDPRYERGDTFFVIGDEKDADALWQRVWQYKNLKHEHEDDGEGIGTQITDYTATVYDESKVDVPTMIVPASISHGVVETAGAPFGVKPGWFWINTNYADYLRHDESGFYVNPELSDGKVRHDEHGFWFSF